MSPGDTNPPLALSVLDFNQRQTGRSDFESLGDAIDLATAADRLRYLRFWTAHPISDSVAHASPEVFAAILAGMTSRIRVGMGAVLFHFVSPLQLACNFRLLATLFPNRIDLGVGRGTVKLEVAERSSMTPGRTRRLVRGTTGGARRATRRRILGGR